MSAKHKPEPRTDLPPPSALLFDIGGVCVLSPMAIIHAYEVTHFLPPGYINFAISRSGHKGAWSLIETGQIILDDDFFAHFKSDLENPKLWHSYLKLQNEKARAAGTGRMYAENSDPPTIDAKKLFWEMMRFSRRPDPHMYPALQRLKKSGTFVVGALSNTTIFPDGIKDHRGEVFESGLDLSDMSSEPSSLNNGGGGAVYGLANGAKAPTIHEWFDCFVSSAHVGLRKPNPEIYHLALEELNKVWKEKGMQGELRPQDVLFLDDIGANLRTARELGFRTVKVERGNVDRAVETLEAVTGQRLRDTKGSRL